MVPTLRPARPADALAVADLLLASRRAFLPWAPLAHGPEEVCSWVRDHLVPFGRVTVACVEQARVPGEEVVGMVATSVTHEVAWIDQLYLLPGWTGQGLGTRLLRHALDGLPRPVRLRTFQANTGARRFYEAHGFQVVETSNGEANEELCPDLLLSLGEKEAPEVG